MANGDQQQIIVKRIKKSGGGHHGGAWKIAYLGYHYLPDTAAVR